MIPPKTEGHSFHIPVMGTGFTIDSPLRVARYGIDSVISLVDDTLIEEMRKYYCKAYHEPYQPITKQEEDYRARRITAYLNLVDQLVKRQFAELKKQEFTAGTDITKYFELLPEHSRLKQLYLRMSEMTDLFQKKKMQDNLRSQMKTGAIQVNIMTKLDRQNFAKDGTPLPDEYSDALSALRGFARSSLHSAVVFSAGINKRLYSYIAEFRDFYADASGQIKKKIILKVSDFRSSLIQGKFLAKKGLWVSEYRVESGLNCGGHAFATQGHLMGPILEEFRLRRQELIDSLHQMFNQVVSLKQKFCFIKPLAVQVTAQGGIGTADEDRFLRAHYRIDSTGWGTPLLLCPEATSLDKSTLNKLAAAGEKDLYLSDVSPLGVPFNNLRSCASEQVKTERMQKGRPGSPCPKGFLVSNTEFTDQPICTASRQYQKLKIEDLARQGLSEEEFQAALTQVFEKSCICHDLGEGAMLQKHIFKAGGQFPAVCPGPNLAYFSRIVSLREMVNHIYGRIDIMTSLSRPHMFLKELQIYIDYLIREFNKALPEMTAKHEAYFLEFKDNLFKGMEYYAELFPQIFEERKEQLKTVLDDLSRLRNQLEDFVNAKMPAQVSPPPPAEACI